MFDVLRVALVSTGAARGIRETSPPPLKVHNFAKKYLKKIECQKANVKTLNSSVILLTYAFFEKSCTKISAL